MPDYQLAAHWRANIVIDGRDCGVFDSVSFPSVTSEVTKYRPGGQQHQVAIGGLPNTEDMTASRAIDRDADHALLKFLYQRRGHGDAQVTAQPLDKNFDPKGQATIYTGKLQSVTPSELDSDSSDVATMELGLVLNDQVA